MLRSLTSTCAADMPLTRISLFRLVSPAAIVTDERGTFKNSARNAMQASLARPSSGGAVSASFTASPTVPVMAFLFARGCTLSRKVAPDGVSRIGIIWRTQHILAVLGAAPLQRCNWDRAFALEGTASGIPS